MSIAENLVSTRNKIPDFVKLVAVSKTKPNSDILDAYNAGQRIFGENKVQDMCAKAEELPKDIEWHMIGHLQTNKVKYLGGFVSLIHSIDSLKLLGVVNKEAAKNERIIDCLMEIKIGQEETKIGFSKEELIEILSSNLYDEMNNIKITGIMGMATFTEDDDLIRREFQELKSIYTDIKSRFFANEDSFKELSMGMSADYELAIEEGSTMVRVGSAIFGARNYG